MRPLLLVLLLLLSLTLPAQTPDSVRIKTAGRFLDGYNRQDYKQIRGTLGGVLKVVFTKSLLKRIFSAQFEQYGPQVDYKIVGSNAKSIRYLLRYERDSTEWANFNFSFNSKNKIVGFWIPGQHFRISSADSLLMKRPREARMAAMDSLFDLKVKSGVFEGCVLVTDASGTMHQRCTGDFNEQTVFELASVSKQFTAVATLQLVAAGKIDLNKEVRHYLPELPYEGVTVAMLLNHTGGIPDYMQLFEKHWDHSKIAMNADVLALLAAKKPKRDFKPGSRHSYSNTGYVLLACLVERVSGKPFADYMRDAIFVPAGMTKSRIYHRRLAGHIPPDLAIGTVWSDSVKRQIVPDSLPDYTYLRYLDGISGDGCVNSTLADLQRWEQALRNNTLLPDTLLAQAWQPTILPDGRKENYGYGWMLQVDSAYVPLIHHGGSWPGYMTYLLFTRDQPGLVIVLSNNDYGNLGPYARQLTGLLTDRK